MFFESVVQRRRCLVTTKFVKFSSLNEFFDRETDLPEADSVSIQVSR